MVGCCGLFLTDLAEHCFEEQVLLVTAGIKKRKLKMAEWWTDSGFNPGNEIRIKACKSIISPRWRVFERASCVVHFKSHLPDILLANGALCDLNYPLSTWNLCNREALPQHVLISLTFVHLKICPFRKHSSARAGQSIEKENRQQVSQWAAQAEHHLRARTRQAGHWSRFPWFLGWQWLGWIQLLHVFWQVQEQLQSFFLWRFLPARHWRY